MPTYDVICTNCQRAFRASRSSARYCSSTCRGQARKARIANEPDAPALRAPRAPDVPITNIRPDPPATDRRDHSWENEFFEVLSNTGNVRAACRAVQVQPSTVYRRRDADPDFAQEWRIADELATQLLEAAAWQRAVHGVEKPVFQGGRQVGSIQVYSDTDLIFLLKARAPEKYRDNHKVEHEIRQVQQQDFRIDFSGQPLRKEAGLMQVNPLYRNLWDVPEWKFCYLRGPRNAGRSHVIAQYAVTLMREEPGNYLFLREFKESVGNSTFNLVKRIIYWCQLQDEFTFNRTVITHKQSGAEATFRSMRNNVESIMSVDDVRFTHFEQAERCDGHNLAIIIPSVVRETGSQAAFSWNPTWPTDHVETRWANAQPEDVCIYSTAQDNPYKDQASHDAAVADMERNYPHLVAWAYGGEYLSVTETNPFGLPGIDRAYARQPEYDPDLEVFAGVDIAWTENPTSDWTAACLMDQRGHVLKTAKWRIEDPLRRKQEVLNFLAPYNPLMTYVDATDGNGGILAEQLAQENIRTFPVKFNQSVKTSLVRNYAVRLADDKLAMAGQVDLYDESRRYGEDENGKFGAVSGHDDVITAAMLAAEAVRVHYG